MSCQDRSRQARPDQDRSGQVRTCKNPSNHLKKKLAYETFFDFVSICLSLFQFFDFVQLTQLCTNFVLFLGHPVVVRNECCSEAHGGSC